MPSKKKSKGGRESVNIVLRPKTRTMGEELATHDKRVFSHELEWLIEAEYRRRFASEAA